MSTRPTKSELRIEIRAWLKTIPRPVRAAASLQVCARLRTQPVWQKAAGILFYAPRSDELDLSPLVDESLDQGRLVALPQFDQSTGSYRACRVECPIAELPRGRYGIPEPALSCARVPMAELDLILIPGLAFDSRGCRLGRGGGYYDRLLEAIVGTKCGIGFDEQLRAEVPIESHDILLDCVVTPTRWLDVRLGRHGDNLGG